MELFEILVIGTGLALDAFAVGFFLGSSFSSFVEQVDHWIAFILLVIIGGNMIKGSRIFL
ncbi:MAG: manganese efflux pump [Clostridia bacterium]|nr:manganese efflux pump [Clostridia bacterium]